MAAHFYPRPFHPPGEPSLAELVDNIRRNLECTSYVPTCPDMGFNQFRDTRFGPIYRNNLRTGNYRSNGGNGDVGDRFPEGEMRPRRYSRGMSQDGPPPGITNRQMGRPGDFAGPLNDGSRGGPPRGGMGSPGVLESPRSPMTLFAVQQHSRGSLAEDIIARELAMAGCNYGRGGSHPPSEIASEDTFDIVDTMSEDWDPENEEWNVTN